MTRQDQILRKPDQYAVPTGFKFEEPKPKYKLFEINWTDDGPMIAREAFPANVMSCPKIDGYRLGWGFASIELVVDDRGTIISSWHQNPCDVRGRQQFAIGKLET